MTTFRFLFYQQDEKAAVRQICEFLGYHYSDDVIDRITQHSTFGSMKKNPMTNPDSLNDRSKDNSTFMRKGSKNRLKSMRADISHKKIIAFFVFR